MTLIWWRLTPPNEGGEQMRERRSFNCQRKPTIESRLRAILDKTSQSSALPERSSSAPLQDTRHRSTHPGPGATQGR